MLGCHLRARVAQASRLEMDLSCSLDTGLTATVSSGIFGVFIALVWRLGCNIPYIMEFFNLLAAKLPLSSRVQSPGM